MGFSDPQSVDVNGAAVSLAGSGSSMQQSQFTSSDRKYRLFVSHESKNRYRHLAQLKLDDIVENPLVDGQKLAQSTWAHLVIDMPKNGITAETATDIANALVAWATPANVAKLVAGEV